MKQLAKNLFITFLFSTLITSALAAIYYAVVQKNGDYQQALSSIISGVFFLNVILLVMSLPTMFLAFNSYWTNVLVRLLLYFCGPLCFILTVFNLRLKPDDGLIYLTAGFVFILVHAWFYYRLNKDKAE